jgi:sarcosine oxidase
MEAFDVVVIGTGGMGAAAAMHLAARGTRVLGLDRFPPGHAWGSSHGQTRLIRLAYFEHPDYVPLLRRAYTLWRNLEQVSGHRLLVESGLLLAGPPSGEAVVGTLRAAGLHRLSVERMTAVEAMARWPALQLPDDWAAVHEACAGHLFVEDCVRAHAECAVRHGARLEHGVDVRGWRTHGTGGRVIVDTDRGSYVADRLVVAAGPWAHGLVRMPELPLRVLRKSLFWYESRGGHDTGRHPDRAHDGAGGLPCFAFETPSGFFYGFPPLDARGIKIAEHTGGEPVADPLAVDRGLDTRERERVEAVLTAHLPGVSRRMTDHAVCLYTMSPDGHFVVGLHPRHPQVAIAAGFSGHGFKFASVVGEILADLALDGRTPAPIGFLSPERFRGNA